MKYLKFFILAVLINPLFSYAADASPTKPIVKDVIIVSHLNSKSYFKVASGGMRLTGGAAILTANCNCTIYDFPITLSYPEKSTYGDMESVIIGIQDGAGKTTTSQATLKSGCSKAYFSPPVEVKAFQTVTMYCITELAKVSTENCGHLVGVEFKSAKTCEMTVLNNAGKQIDVIGESEKYITELHRIVPYVYTDNYINITKGGYQPICEFVIGAVGDGSVNIAKLSLRQMGTTKAKSVSIFGYYDPERAQPMQDLGRPDGQLTPGSVMCVSDITSIFPETIDGKNGMITIPSGKFRYFTVMADVETSSDTDYFYTQVFGDDSHRGPSTFSTLQDDAKFIWSENLNGKDTFSSPVWHNGYGVDWLPVVNVSGIAIVAPGKG